MPSTISVDQKAPNNHKLLQARHWRWKVAERWQVVQLVAVVAIPLAASLYGLFNPDARPAIALGAAFLTMLDAVLIDRAYRGAIKRAAKASEHFDVAVLRLPWNRLAAGNKLEPEELNEAAAAWQARHPNEQPSDWYPAEVDRAPLGVARVICQRTNVDYDSKLRRTYATTLTVSLAVILFAILAYGLASSATLTELLIGTVVPIAPLLVFGIRDAFRHSDAAKANDLIRDESGRVLEAVIAGDCDDATCEARSSQMQAALFARRTANPLILPGIYKYARPSLEKRMAQNAEHWVQEAGF